MKKIISVLLTVFMLVNLLVVAAVPTAAAAVDLDENTAIVNLNAQETDTTVVWQGTTYNVTYGTNYFNTFNGARDKLTAGCTIMLMPGSYGAIAPGKSMTILGPQADVNPNVKGANATDAWTLNAARSTTDTTKEAIFTGAVYMTTGGDAAISGTTSIVIDGVAFSTGYIRTLNYSECVQNITVKNSIVGNAAVNFIWAYNSSSTASTDTVDTNLCQRNITLKNIHVSGATKSLLGSLPAESLNISGLFMDNTCTNALINGLYIPSTVTTNPINYSITDSMFMQNTRVMNISFRDSTISALKTKNASNTRNTTVTVDSCVFKGNDMASSSTDGIIATQPHNDYTSFVITNNIFDQTGNTNTVNRCIQEYSEGTNKTNYTIDNNSFINVQFALCMSTVNTATPVKVTRSYYDGTNGTGVSPKFWSANNNVTIVNYYTNAEKTRLAYASAPIAVKGVQQSAPDANDKVDLRFIVALDKLDDLKEIGVYLTADEDSNDTVILTAKQSVTTVYKKIKATTDNGIVEYTAADLGAKYLMAIIVEDVPANVAFTVQPYAVYNDGVNVVTAAADVVVTNSVVADPTVSTTDYRIDIPAADTLATYAGTTVNEDTLTFTYTGANADDVTAYAELLKAAGFVAGANIGEYVNSATDTKVAVTLDAGTLTISTASCL